MVEPLTATKISEHQAILQESIEEQKELSTLNCVPTGSRIFQYRPPDSVCHEKEICVSELDENKSEPNERVASSGIIEYETTKNQGTCRLFGGSKEQYNQCPTAGQNTTANNRRRTMLVRLSDQWAVRKVLLKAPMLNVTNPKKKRIRCSCQTP